MRYFILLILTFPFYSNSQDSITKIAFGSCGHQDKPLDIFTTIVSHHPDLFIFLGDNIYGDTDNMFKLRRKYKKLGKNKNYKHLKENAPIIATWDDHDYGQNDIGKYYKKKLKSKKLFLKFFEEDENSPRWEHEGIYTSYYYQSGGKNLQIILLDCRTFRDNLLPYNGFLKEDSLYVYNLDYSPIPTPDSTFLGEQQWKWLESELKKDADVRIIGSSTQFATQFNGYETWANFPFEQQRMLDLIKSTEAKGVFFISGDVHYSELSRIENNGSYPIFDLTCSGLTEEWSFATPNINRIGTPIMENHFGIIELNLSQDEPMIQLQVWDFNNILRLNQALYLRELH